MYTMSELVDTTAEEKDLRDPVWNRALVWSTLGLIGWLGFELTAQPAVAAAVVCSRFGWNHFRTAIWLRRNDWNRERARACSWFILAAGVLRIVVFAFLLTLLFSMAVVAWAGPQRPRNPNGPMPAIFIGPLILIIAGPPLAALLVAIGAITAHLNNIRVWIDERLDRARRANSWPPPFLDMPAASIQNVARGPWLLTLAVACVGSLLLAVFVFALSSSWLCGLAALIAPLGAISLLSRGLFASTPDECWGDVAADAITHVGYLPPGGGPQDD
jgi:hypothetical protein